MYVYLYIICYYMYTYITIGLSISLIKWRSRRYHALVINIESRHDSESVSDSVPDSDLGSCSSFVMLSTSNFRLGRSSSHLRKKSVLPLERGVSTPFFRGMAT